MRRDSDNPFSVRLGYLTSSDGSLPHLMSFAKKVEWASKQMTKKELRRSYRGRARTTAEKYFARRVIVKFSVVKMGGRGGETQRLHLKYIEREGVGRDEERGVIFDRRNDETDIDGFRKRGLKDKHQFRVIVSAEDARELTDLRAFTRDLMSQMERDLGTRLDWVAANHYDTGTPHTHIVISGKDDMGRTLTIPRGYISYGMRFEAEKIVNMELGPIVQLEYGKRLALDIDRMRYTPLDRMVLNLADGDTIDLSKTPVRGTEWTRRIVVARLRKLAQMAMVEPCKGRKWTLDKDVRGQLIKLGLNTDIRKTYEKVLEQSGITRSNTFGRMYEPFHRRAKPLTGKIIGIGMQDDVNDKSYIVLDTTCGKAKYVAMGRGENIEGLGRGMTVHISPADVAPKNSDYTIAKLAQERGGSYSPSAHLESDQSASNEFVQAHIRRLEAMRRAGHVSRNQDGSWEIPNDYLRNAENYEMQRASVKPVILKVLAKEPLENLQTVMARTWIDEAIASGETVEGVGFGKEVKTTIIARRQFLVEQGLLETENGKINTKLLGDLESRDLKAAGSKISAALGKPYSEALTSGRTSGIYLEPIERPSGKYAIMERAKDFTLVPWRDMLERNRGKSISGIMRGNSISLTLGRDRGRGIG